jgi:hypothetical protein
VRNLTALVMLLLLLVFGGCGGGSSMPSEKDLEAAIKKKEMADKPYAKLVSFRKTNGVAESPSSYRVEYEGEIELTEDCYCDKNGLILHSVKYVESLPKDSPTRLAEENFARDGLRTVTKKGERKRIAGNWEFEKTEKGWR